MTQPAAEQPRRIPLDELTSDALDQLYAERDRYRAAWNSARDRAADRKSLYAALGDDYRIAIRAAEHADAVTVETKRLMERRTTTLRARAEKAEADRDAAVARLYELGVTTNPEPSWQCPDCDGLVPHSQRYIHQEAEQRARAERDQAAVERVRATAHALNLEVGRHRGNGDPETLGYRLGLAEAVRRIHAALDEQQEQTATPAVHVGGNAEGCPACTGTNPPYPFLCPGPKEK